MAKKILDDTDPVLLCNSQTLTDEQKKAARCNIGAQFTSVYYFWMSNHANDLVTLCTSGEAGIVAAGNTVTEETAGKSNAGMTFPLLVIPGHQSYGTRYFSALDNGGQFWKGSVSLGSGQLTGLEKVDAALPTASEDTLGGVKPVAAASDMTQPVGVDEDGRLFTAVPDMDISLGVESAAVGQIIKVKTVDTDGCPTSWEAADMPGGSEGSGGSETWESVTFTIPEDDPVSVATFNLPSANITKACIRISLFGTLENTKFGVMVFTGATTGDTYLPAEINDFYTSAQAVRTGVITLEKQGGFWRSFYNTTATIGRRNTTGALRLTEYKSDYLYLRTTTANETFYGTVEVYYVTGGSV